MLHETRCFLPHCHEEDAGKVDDMYANSASVLLSLLQFENRVPMCSLTNLCGVLCVIVRRSEVGYDNLECAYM